MQMVEMQRIYIPKAGIPAGRITGHEMLNTGRLTLELTTSKETFWGMALGTAREEKQGEMGQGAINSQIPTSYTQYFSRRTERSVFFLHVVYNLLTSVHIIQVALQRSPRERKNQLHLLIPARL